MRLGSGVVVAVDSHATYSSDWPPSLGTSICYCVTLKRQRKKKERNLNSFCPKLRGLKENLDISKEIGKLQRRTMVVI